VRGPGETDEGAEAGKSEGRESERGARDGIAPAARPPHKKVAAVAFRPSPSAGRRLAMCRHTLDRQYSIV
jgi:hypothetical protein